MDLNKQVIVIDRFGNVVKGAQLSRPNGVPAARICRHDDDGCVVLFGAQSFQNSQAIKIGQANVEKYKIRTFGSGRDRNPSIARSAWRISYPSSPSSELSA